MEFCCCSRIIIITQVYATATAKSKLTSLDNFGTYQTECAASLAVRLEDVDIMRSTEKSPCFAKCVFEKLGFFDGTKGFNVENFVDKLGEGQHDTEVRRLRSEFLYCADKNPQKSDACEWANRGIDCLKKAGLLD